MTILENYVINVAMASDIGCVRHNNEDAIRYIAAEGNPKTGVAIVADGMGGHRAGEVASQEAVDIIGDFCLSRGFSDPQSTLNHAYHETNKKIYRHAAERIECRGMGTTATALMICDGQGYFSHVGDSRLYRIREGQIEQLTKDHTLVAQMLDYGMISAEEARHHPKKNILTNALGTSPDIFVEFPGQPLALRINDAFLLCSDGLYDRLEDEEILQIILRNSSDEACGQLVNAANDKGGNDNVSVIILVIEKRP